MYGIKKNINVVLRDEEIMFPGTYEYAERIAKREGVNFYWIVANQPIVNIFDRVNPYFWVFDPLAKDKWVREPYKDTIYIGELNITEITAKKRFGYPKDVIMYNCIGIRTSESMRRKLAIRSSKGYLCKPDSENVIKSRPIYDWCDGDIWKFHKDFKLDYNEAYDTMYRLGIPNTKLRIAPPTMSAMGLINLQGAARAWPRWFDAVCKRLGGVRSAVNFGKRAITPDRRLNETWQECFYRTCVNEAPVWIKERALKMEAWAVTQHNKKSTYPFPHKSNKKGGVNAYFDSYERLTKIMYAGDPFCIKAPTSVVGYVEPDYFRADAGKWGGKPSF